MADESGEMRIEQARIYMPDIRVYYYPGNSSVDDLTASLNGEKLKLIGSHPYSEDQNGTDYYILVDVSLSISKEYFADIRQALIQFPDSMKENDTLTVITFGDQVSVVLDKAKKSEISASTLESLDNTGMNTHLFEAFDKTAELADREENLGKRNIAIVISDGEDCSTNENTKSEALEGFQKTGIPLYAMAVRETAHGEANAFIEDFSDFARATQGQLFVFGLGEAADCIQNIQRTLETAQVLELKASSNRITSVMQPLTLVVSGAGSESLEVCPRYNQKDNEAPTAAAEQISEKELRIVFSEPVQNAGEESNYKVLYQETQIPVYTVNYNETEAPAAILTFREALKGGGYTVEFQNICDNSMEENPLSGNAQITVELETEPPETEPPETEPPETEPPEIQKGGIPKQAAAAAGAAILLIIILIIVIIMRKRKKARTEPAPSLEPTKLKFAIRGEEENKTVEMEIQDKLTVGRSSSCDVAVVDKLLSRRHFMVEKDSGSFYISDLGTTNGTIVNGIKIVTRCKLKNGDVVQAGSLFITITW